MRWCVQDYESKDDDALVLLAKAGDGDAAEELMLRYKNMIRGIARKFAFGTLAETDDLVQEGMIALYAAIGNYVPTQGKFKNFARLCAERRICSYLRFVGRRDPEGSRSEVDPETIPVDDTPEERVLTDEADGEFRMRLLSALSDFEFRVVTYYLDGMSYAQISESTGRDLKSIDNALARAKRKLQRVFRS